MRKTPWQHLRDNPPLFAFLMARRKVSGKCVQALSLQEIAIASGLTLFRVSEISWMLNWDDVKVTEAERYLAGCNFDPLNATDRNRKNAYISGKDRRTNPGSMFTYLKKSPLWLTHYKPRIERLRSLKGSSTPSAK
jgi:hypothetical protein